MNFWHRFISNSFLLSVTEILNKGFPFFIILVLIKELGVEANGQFAASLALAGLFTIFTDIGLSTLLVRDVSRDKLQAGHYASVILSLKLLLSLVILLIGSVFIYYTKEKDVFGIYFLGLVYILLDNINVNIFQSALRAINRVDKEAISKLVRGITLLGGGLFGIYVIKNIYGVLWGYIISAIIQSIVCLYYCRKNNVQIKLAIHIKEWKRFISLSVQFFINNLLSMVYYSIGTTLLSYIKGDVETGLYNSAYVFFGGFYALGAVLHMAVFPLLSHLYTASQKEWLRLYRKVAAFTFIFSICGVLVLFFLAPRFMPYIVEDVQATKAIVCLQIISFGLIFSFQNTILGALFNSSHNEKKLVIPVLSGTAINVVLNLLAIPYYGLYGCAVATLFTEFCVFCVLLMLYKKHIKL